MILRFLVFSYLLLGIIGCASFTAHFSTTYPPELASMIDEYIEYKKLHMDKDYFKRPQNISFGELEGTNIGKCINYWTHGEIILDRSWWDQSDYYAQLELLYHEFGHCDLDYLHIEGTIMDAYHMGLLNHENLEEQLELFFNKDRMVENGVKTKCEH